MQTSMFYCPIVVKGGSLIITIIISMIIIISSSSIPIITAISHSSYCWLMLVKKQKKKHPIVFHCWFQWYHPIVGWFIRPVERWHPDHPPGIPSHGGYQGDGMISGLDVPFWGFWTSLTFKYLLEIASFYPLSCWVMSKIKTFHSPSHYTTLFVGSVTTFHV